MDQPFFKIDETGAVSILDAEQVQRPPAVDYCISPVRIDVSRHLKVTMSGRHFTASTRLSVDQAMSLAMLLLYACREDPRVSGRSGEAV